MAEEIKSPKLSKRGQVVLAVGGAGVVGFLYWRNRQSAQATAVNPADQVTTDGSTTSDLGLGQPTDSGPGAYGTQYSAASNTTVGSVSTNSDWYQNALLAAEDAGYDSQTAATALSQYLSHQPLSSLQQTIVRIGLAAAGNPPQGTYSIVSPTPPPKPPVVTPPKPPADVAPKTPANFRVISLGTTSVTFGWNTSVGGAYQYHVYEGSRRVGTVFGTFFGLNGLAKGHKYGPFTVKAVSKGGKESPASNPLTITTKTK